jgi:hypothetical protein
MDLALLAERCCLVLAKVTNADVCGCMRTYADVCWRMLLAERCCLVLAKVTNADVCGLLRTSADVCGLLLAYADVC